jgi:hypothetical protein
LIITLTAWPSTSLVERVDGQHRGRGEHGDEEAGQRRRPLIEKMRYRSDIEETGENEKLDTDAEYQ